MNIVILGLSLTSSWGNGHATTYRGLMRELCARGHQVLFLERNVPWYAQNRDLPHPPYGRTELYGSPDNLNGLDALEDLKTRFTKPVCTADLVIVGSYVPDGVAVGEWVVQHTQGIPAFYDIDTPVTLAKLARGDYEYLSPHLIPRYRLYLSFTGGPILITLENTWGSPCARPLYCAVDPSLYYPVPTVPRGEGRAYNGGKQGEQDAQEKQQEQPDQVKQKNPEEQEDQEILWDLGYMGTYSDDRQPPLENLLLHPARRWEAGRFVVAGPQYPDSIVWPPNVTRIAHLPPAEHRAFYNRQRFTLNITRADMIQAGYSPSVRLFEAAACGVPIISDIWEGLESFFMPGSEILLARSPDETLAYLRDMSETQRCEIGNRARQRVLAQHTAAHRALELENYVRELER